MISPNIGGRAPTGSPQASMQANHPYGSNRCRWASRRGLPRGGSGRPEAERRAVHAIALAGRFRPVVEDMPQMPAAAPAMHLGARIAELVVGCDRDRAFQRRPEAQIGRAHGGTPVTN